MTKRFLATILLIVLAMWGLQACAKLPASDPLAGIATPIPAYVATDQAVALQARGTRQAGEGRLVELAGEATVISLQMTASSATEAYFAHQTEQAQYMAATATQEALQATGTAVAALHTQAALNSAGTATQAALNAAGTGTQAAYSVQQTSTAIALGVFQVSATAEVARIAEQRRSEQQTLLFRTWAWRIALVILFAVGLIITWQSVSWVLLRAFGIYRLANRPVVITPNGKGGFNIFDISRSLQPGASVGQDGKVMIGGGADDIHIQNQVASRAQAAELLLAANSGQVLPAAQRRALLHRALQAGQPLAPSPAGDVADTQVIIISPDDPRVRPLLDEVEPKLLNGGGQA